MLRDSSSMKWVRARRLVNNDGRLLYLVCVNTLSSWIAL